MSSFHRSALVCLIVAMGLAGTGCGGRSSTPLPPALAVSLLGALPSFVSTPPIESRESSPYTYTLAADDPAGHPVAFFLEEAPAGAALNGNLLSWIPTVAQARSENRFTVIAASAAGRVRQTWTVTPSGTVRGHCLDTYWTVKHPLTVPNNACSARLLLPQEDGSIRVQPVSSGLDGSFVVEDVPGGHFWLDAGSGQYLWTSSSEIDLGSDYTGRPDSGMVEAQLALSLNGLAPWQEDDQLNLLLPNSSSSYSIPLDTALKPGETVVRRIRTVSLPAVTPASGDLAYVTQQRQDTASVPGFKLTRIAGMYAVPGLTVQGDGAAASVIGALQPLDATHALELAFGFSAYQRLAPVIHPSFVFNKVSAGVQIEPAVTDRLGAIGKIELLDLTTGNPPLVDRDFGAFPYGSQFPPTWPVLWRYEQSGNAWLRVPGSGAILAVPGSLGHRGAAMPSAGQPELPVLAPVTDLRLNGGRLSETIRFTGPVTLSWTPSYGAASPSYSVAVESVAADGKGGFQASVVASLTTTSPWVRVPGDVFGQGNMYFFVVTAMNNPLANSAGPYHLGIPYAWADAISDIVSYAGEN